MAQSESGVETGTEEVGVEETPPEFDNLANVFADGVIGALGGFTGTAIMTVVLLVATSLGAFDTAAFGTLAMLIGADALLPADLIVPFGYLLFLGAGMTIWPLLFASIGRYLPGRTYAIRGLPYGFVLWTGFVLPFYDGYSGAGLAIYAVATLIGHLGYGFALGSVFDFFSMRSDLMV